MKYFYWLIGLGVLAGIAYLAAQYQPKAGQPQNQTALVVVDSPAANATIISPLSVSGTAVGNWYFEASFPIELLDANNQIIGSGIAEAQSDWMVTTPVPFVATIVFPPQPAGSTGTLVLHKDNPSGEPQFDAQFTVPVVF